MGGLLDRTIRELEGASVPDEWLAQTSRTLQMRLAQIERSPESAPFLLRAMIEPDARSVIGHIGFHGLPGANALGAADALEIGYGVLPAFRRRGYAIEAVLGMIAWAERAHDIHRFLASVGPWNAASLALVRKLGFTEVARVMDEEDGEEIVHELRR